VWVVVRRALVRAAREVVVPVVGVCAMRTRSMKVCVLVGVRVLV
jgi:hypothetical protein